MKTKGKRQSKNIEDARDTPGLSQAQLNKQEMDANENVSNLVEKTPVKDWKRADPIEGIIDTNKMFRSKSNRTRTETELQHLTGPASQLPKFTKIKTRLK